MSDEECNNPFHNHGDDDGHMHMMRALPGPDGLLLVPVEDIVRLFEDHAARALAVYMETRDQRPLLGIEILSHLRALFTSLGEVVEQVQEREQEIDRTVEETLAGGWEEELERALREHAGGSAEPVETPRDVEKVIDEVREQLDTSDTDGPVDEYTAMLERLAEQMRGKDNDTGE